MKALNKQIKRIVLGTGFLCSSLSFALYEPELEKPILVAEVNPEEIMKASNAFESVTNIKISLNRKVANKTPTSIALSFLDAENSKTIIEVPIIQKTNLDCGSVSFAAQKIYNGHRQSIVLIDHTQRKANCGEDVTASWMVRVRDGYGFCGTMDSVLNINTNPTHVYSISDIVNPIVSK